MRPFYALHYCRLQLPSVMGGNFNNERCAMKTHKQSSSVRMAQYSTTGGENEQLYNLSKTQETSQTRWTERMQEPAGGVWLLCSYFLQMKHYLHFHVANSKRNQHMPMWDSTKAGSKRATAIHDSGIEGQSLHGEWQRGVNKWCQGPHITISRASDHSLALNMKEHLAAIYLDTSGEARYVCPF